MDGRTVRRIVALRRLTGVVVVALGGIVIFVAAALASMLTLPEHVILVSVLVGIGAVLLGIHIIWWVRDLASALVVDAFGLMMATFAAVPLWGDAGLVFAGVGFLLLIACFVPFPLGGRDMRQRDRRRRRRQRRQEQKWAKQSEGLRFDSAEKQSSQPRKGRDPVNRCMRNRIGRGIEWGCMILQLVALSLWLGLSWPLSSRDAAFIGFWVAAGAWVGIVAATLIRRPYEDARTYIGLYVAMASVMAGLGLGLTVHWGVGLVVGGALAVAGLFMTPVYDE